MSAQLAQGDISLDCYQSQMTYHFGDILRQVLGIEKNKGADEWPELNG
jgi:hypothetical protein